ncbi:hypothetical protein LAZ67_16001902 [Cordylochernes scorpioides]|uniref:Transposase n=1 Tax=Cordylochernes scorpioides TaxID=51811 RepID=A0ABY6LE87_9ARAC|nr:hypothetical protein LAZ67_16001902 [Cordylochernes scorpioides]
MVHYEFVPESQTINQHYYHYVLRRLREAVRQKRPEKWHQKNWLLHHDNARPHTAFTVQLYLAKHGIALLPQPPYSPDLAPKDFLLYPKIKKSFKRTPDGGMVAHFLATISHSKSYERGCGSARKRRPNRSQIRSLSEKSEETVAMKASRFHAGHVGCACFEKSGVILLENGIWYPLKEE